MQVVSTRCCSRDVQQKSVVAGSLLTDPDGTVHREVQPFGTITADLRALNDWLNTRQVTQVTQVALESTGVSWGPVFNLVEAEHEIILGNAQPLKAVPGRKTDVKDAEWLAGCALAGCARASFRPRRCVPSANCRASVRRLSTPALKRSNRLPKPRERANRKRGAGAPDVLGKRGREMLAALLSGEQRPATLPATLAETLAEWARGRLRAKLPQLRQALNGRVQAQHRVLIRHVRAPSDCIAEQLEPLTPEIAAALTPFTEAVALLETIPCIGHTAAVAIIAELGTDMGRFPSAKHLAA